MDKYLFFMVIDANRDAASEPSGLKDSAFGKSVSSKLCIFVENTFPLKAKKNETHEFCWHFGQIP